MQERLQAVRDARLLAYRNPTAVLSTLSQKLQGMPFGSVSPVMLTDEGHVVFYVSDIAQHAKNLTADPRLSVTFYNPAPFGDQNEQGRLTLSGRATPMQDNEAGRYTERYYRLFPAAKGYKSAHDFRFWKMNVESIRFIGGFGEIFWLTMDEWLAPSPDWQPDDETRMVEHMNEDHGDACQLILMRHLTVGAGSERGLSPGSNVVMKAIYPDGCYFEAEQRLHFVSFWDEAQADRCLTSQDVRKVLVQLTQMARAA